MNRREAERHTVWVPVEVRDSGGGRKLAVSSDVSETGASLVSPARAQVGEEVELALHFPDGSKKQVSGRVVRIEANPEDPHGAFPHRIAVAFEGRAQGLDPVLAKVEEPEEERD